jgi:hypothetical protein
LSIAAAHRTRDVWEPGGALRPIEQAYHFRYYNTPYTVLNYRFPKSAAFAMVSDVSTSLFSD